MLLMPKAGKYKWFSSLRVLVYNASVYPKGLFKRLQHCPTLLDQQCWTIVGQRVQTDATISKQLLAVQLVQNSVRK